jgi:hypothetical protein
MKATAERKWGHPDVQKIVTLVAKGDGGKIAALHSAVDYLGAVVTYPALEEKLPVPEAFDHPLFVSIKEINELPGRALRRALIKIKEEPIPQQKLLAENVVINYIVGTLNTLSQIDTDPSPKIVKSPFIGPQLLAERFGIPLKTTVGLLSDCPRLFDEYLESQAVKILFSSIKPSETQVWPTQKIPEYRKKRDWVNDPDPVSLIQSEARMLIRDHGDITVEDMYRRKIFHGVYDYYPGQFVQLRWDFGLPLAEKPKGYWTMDTLRTEVKAILAEHGQFTRTIAERIGKDDVRAAIERLTGKGIPDFLRSLGVKPVHNRRNPEIVDEEALGVWLQYGNITEKSLRTVKGLFAAIPRHSEGKYVGLRQRVEAKGMQILEEAYAENKRHSNNT